MIGRLLPLTLLALASADRPSDLVKSLPGFGDVPSNFKVYSGFLDVKYSPAVNGYDGARIHYQFHTSQSSNATADPVVAWHTGGPGGSSIYGQYAELGYFQVSTSAGETINKHSWNNVANMLYLEAPAGSFITPVDQHSGFSYCTKGGVRQRVCKWNDLTQAEAYGHTLLAFFEAFPEYKANEFYLAGESYAGMYIPNIATRLLAAVPEINLKGIAVGNGCWGGDATSVECNGPNSNANLVQLYFGKGMISSKLHAKIMKTCGYNNDEQEAVDGVMCDLALAEMDKAVGPHNVYNVYDNCPNLDVDRWVELSGKSRRWLRQYLASNMANLPNAHAELNRMAGLSGLADAELGNPASGGGFDWTCGQFEALPQYFKRADVRSALNLPASNANGSTFSYDSSGPASVTLYPALIKKIRVLIYNGDADSCVPYVGNEEWTTSMATSGVVSEVKAWHPWYFDASESSPAGYATGYSDNFQFLTIRLAGHQVPKNMPEAALAIITGFLQNKQF